jgi:hypothetical protein
VPSTVILHVQHHGVADCLSAGAVQGDGRRDGDYLSALPDGEVPPIPPVRTADLTDLAQDFIGVGDVES